MKGWTYTKGRKSVLKEWTADRWGNLTEENPNVTQQGHEGAQHTNTEQQ